MPNYVPTREHLAAAKESGKAIHAVRPEFVPAAVREAAQWAADLAASVIDIEIPPVTVLWFKNFGGLINGSAAAGTSTIRLRSDLTVAEAVRSAAHEAYHCSAPPEFAGNEDSACRLAELVMYAWKERLQLWAGSDEMGAKGWIFEAYKGHAGSGDMLVWLGSDGQIHTRLNDVTASSAAAGYVCWR
jgi:hypothetical protein